ncbi:MAG: hypothetical protein J3R72DRAFT_425882 [Linnemannia gamsii]|nr:MAG: hypothetical protein J3R72DRAFT_425882 [Linnemannia gamsii]
MVAHSKSQRTTRSTFSLLTLTTISLLSLSPSSLFTNAQSNPTPTQVFCAGTARTPTRFFVLSGATALSKNNPYPTANQFFYLDLATSWTSIAPAWVQLRPGPQTNYFPGTATADSKNLFFFNIPDSSPVYQFSVETGNWFPAPGATKIPISSGFGAVTDPNTDLIYLAGGGYSAGASAAHGSLGVWSYKTDTITKSPLPAPTALFADRNYFTSAWCKSRQSILYWGGHGNGALTRGNLLTELRPPGEWSTLVTTGVGPPTLFDHCMAINDEGTKLIVYGGKMEGDVFSSQLFILDISSRTWSSGPAGAIPRSYMACTFAGDQFIVWGGVFSMAQMANSEAEIFNLTSNTWIKQYVPPASYQNMVVAGIPGAVGARPPGGTPPNTNTTVSGGGDKSSGGSSIGGVVGGVAGGLVVVAIIGFLIYRRRKTSATAKPSIYPPGTGQGQGYVEGKMEDDVGAYYEPRPFIAASPEQHAAGASVPLSVPRQAQSPQLFSSEPGTPGLTNQIYQGSPQGPQAVAGSGAYQLKMQEIENQRQQLELKRQLLILEEQGLLLRPAPPPQYQHQQQQKQYQQQRQYPMSMGMSDGDSTYPMTTAATVQALPVSTGPSAPPMGQYYSTSPSAPPMGQYYSTGYAGDLNSYEPYTAVPVEYVPTTGAGNSPQSMTNSGLVTTYTVPPVSNSSSNAEGAGNAKRLNPHAFI